MSGLLLESHIPCACHIVGFLRGRPLGLGTGGASINEGAGASIGEGTGAIDDSSSSRWVAVGCAFGMGTLIIPGRIGLVHRRSLK